MNNKKLIEILSHAGTTEADDLLAACNQAVLLIESQAAKIERLTEEVDDLMSQIDDCASDHDLCVKLTLLVETIRENRAALNETAVSAIKGEGK